MLREQVPYKRQVIGLVCCEALSPPQVENWKRGYVAEYLEWHIKVSGERDTLNAHGFFLMMLRSRLSGGVLFAWSRLCLV